MNSVPSLKFSQRIANRINIKTERNCSTVQRVSLHCIFNEWTFYVHTESTKSSGNFCLILSNVMTPLKSERSINLHKRSINNNNLSIFFVVFFLSYYSLNDKLFLLKYIRQEDSTSKSKVPLSIHFIIAPFNLTHWFPYSEF